MLHILGKHLGQNLNEMWWGPVKDISDVMILLQRIYTLLVSRPLGWMIKHHQGQGSDQDLTYSNPSLSNIKTDQKLHYTRFFYGQQFSRCQQEVWFICQVAFNVCIKIHVTAHLITSQTCFSPLFWPKLIVLSLHWQKLYLAHSDVTNLKKVRL